MSLSVPEPGAGRLRRLGEELAESGLRLDGGGLFRAMLVEEVDRALPPPDHERRVPSSGVILDPMSDSATWAAGTQLDIARQPLDRHAVDPTRRFTDGLSSWIIRRTGGTAEWMVLDRPAGSERDLVVLASVLEATVVQRHPAGSVRIVGAFGVLRWEGLDWHHEPPVGSWTDAMGPETHGDPTVLKAMLEFAVHDLGSMGIGSLLVYRPDSGSGPPVEERLPPPLPLQIRRAAHLAPLRHALAQVDGAAFFDREGVLRKLGVRLIPSKTAEETVQAFGGTRHISGRRYSYDDPSATVIAVSEDGPVSVLRNGEVLGDLRGN